MRNPTGKFVVGQINSFRYKFDTGRVRRILTIIVGLIREGAFAREGTSKLISIHFYLFTEYNSAPGDTLTLTLPTARFSKHGLHVFRVSDEDSGA